MPATTCLEDAIEIYTPGRRNRKLLVYFICGNPGLVEYYRSFLHALQRRLPNTRDVVIYGASHDGFELHAPTNRANTGPPPFSLQEEIHSVTMKLSLKAREVAQSTAAADGSTREPVDVVLVGHSVGSYMLLDVLTWWQSHPPEQDMYRIRGGICLFPTIVDIVKSEKARQIGWLINWRYSGHLLTQLANGLDWVGLLNPLAKVLTPGAAGWEVTAALARSDSGVRQVIHMARDELAQITHDKWDAEKVWGLHEHSLHGDAETTIITADGEGHELRTKLFLLFANNDYWVNNESRDRLMANRASRHTKFEVLRDRPEIPHTFSLHPDATDHVAEKTAAWIEELLWRGGKQ